MRKAGERESVLSYKGRTVDAWGQEADEGRGKRRNASGSSNHAMIRGYPNGVTQWVLNHSLLPPEHIGRVEGSPGTETSKYRDEKKSIEIVQVAASERAEA